ncbi:MAG: hypothetical protein R6W69_05505 [Anaerolineales bacterium]
MNSYYTDLIPGWQVERDEVIGGYRYIALTGEHPLSAVYDKPTLERVLGQNSNLDEGMLDIEILNSTAHAGEGRLNIIFEQGLPPTSIPEGEPLRIPGDITLIILVDYVKQDLAATATPDPQAPEPTATEPREQGLSQVCQEALQTNLCSNPYFPPVEGLTLVYQVDGQRTQTRQIGSVQTGLQMPDGTPADSFSVLFVDDNFTAEMEYYCTEDGLVGGDTSSMLASVLEGQDTGGEQIKVESTTFEGLTLPNNISPGDTWQSRVEVVYSAPEGVLLRSIGHASYLFEGYESVKVPAGVFQAQKIIAEVEVEVVAELPDGHVIPLSKVRLTNISYNVECIGMVMSQGESSLQLLEVILP